MADHLKTVVVKQTVVEEYEAVKFAVVEDMFMIPLSLTMDSETEDRRYYNDEELEEVLAEHEEQFGVFPPTKKKVVMKRFAVKDKNKDKLEEVLKDADEPHLPTFVQGMYWVASKSLQSSSYL